MKETRRLVRLAVAASLAFAAPAWADDESDAEFVKKAASGGMLEVELGRHVAKNAANAEVRAFGERMVTDHGAANRELESVARSSGIAVPTELDEDQRETKERLTALRGAELDRAYMSAMVEDHRHDVEEFEEQAQEGKSEIDRWAARTLPTLQSHLAQAETVADRIEDASETSTSGAPGATSREGYDPTDPDALPAGPDPMRVPDRP
jgi:putative membrane protein